MFSCERLNRALSIIVLALAAAPFPAPAQPFEPINPLVVSGGIQSDDEGSFGAYVGLDYGLTEKDWLTFTGGYTESADELADITTRFVGASLDHDFGRMSVTGGMEYWGDPDEIDSIDLSTSVSVKAGSWRLTAFGELRNVNVTFRFINVLGVLVDVTEDLEVMGIGGRVRYRGDGPWSLHLSHTDYDYSRDPRLLNFLFRFRLLSASALTIANGFFERSSATGVEYTFVNSSVFFNFNHDKGAVDLLETNTYSLGLVTPVAERWDIEVRAGVTETEDLDNSFFGGIGFYFYR